ncbi:cytochrome b [Psychrobium sp. 1_MG-2023]|uniref:cytochrome b n=1 Tax=Psychrobium sp. 1_MG-2023 TaxID=3062624 RepID=UPI001291DA31|nr:cytochrome b [Psychrobium sp. 1_MG-2023]MDP2562660.1 cytochrome b [Psychrobium sp. 1_MG-2023]
MNRLEQRQQVNRFIHWLFACFIITMLSVGFYMKNTDYSATLYQLHKAFGVVFLSIISLRYYWRIKHPWSSVEQGTGQSKIANRVHWLLLTLMGLMPITGFLLSALSGFGIHVLGLSIVPQNMDVAGNIVPFHEATYQLSKQLHSIFAYSFAGLISLHITAALKHHFIDKDATLSRMLSAK